MSSFLPKKGINNLYHFTFQSKTHFWLISTLQYIIYSTYILYIGKVGYFWRAYEGVEHKPLDFNTLVCISVSYFPSISGSCYRAQEQVACSAALAKHDFQTRQSITDNNLRQVEIQGQQQLQQQQQQEISLPIFLPVRPGPYFSTIEGDQGGKIGSRPVVLVKTVEYERAGTCRFFLTT